MQTWLQSTFMRDKNISAHMYTKAHSSDHPLTFSINLFLKISTTLLLSKISSCMSIKTCSDWFGACFIFETPFKFKRHTRKTMYSISFYVLSVQQIQRLCEGVQMEGSVRLVIKTREEFQKESYNKSPQETCQSALEHPFYWIYKGWWWWWGYHVRSKCDLLYDK